MTNIAKPISYSQSWTFFERDCHEGNVPIIGRARTQAHDIQAYDIDVRIRILVLVKAILEQNSIVVEIRPGSSLIDSGLTSMDMVSLMLGVEAEFDFTIPQDQITPDNFRSIAALERMIVSQLQLALAA